MEFGPMDTPFFYPAETPGLHRVAQVGEHDGKLTDIHDIVPIVKFLATDGRWITGQTIFANGGYTRR